MKLKLALIPMFREQKTGNLYKTRNGTTMLPAITSTFYQSNSVVHAHSQLIINESSETPKTWD